jgi:ribosomal protein L16 Arg81 hydroxylase
MKRHWASKSFRLHQALPEAISPVAAVALARLANFDPS